MKKLMILGASILQLPAILKAKEMGIQTIAVDMNKDALGFKYADISLEISTIDIHKVVDAAKKYCIDGIITLASDIPMRTVATVAKELNIAGISELTALKATNKALMRECLKENNVPVPCFYRVKSYKDYINALKNFSEGYIVKPVDNSGSRGVFLVNDKNKTLIDFAFEYSIKYSYGGELIVEEYMEGPEVSVETLSIDGVLHVIAITDKITTGAPRFVEMGHSQPSQLDEYTKEEIIKITVAAIKAIGIENGPSHTEIIVTKHGPKIVEIGARLGGDNITTHLVPLSTGIDMVKCCIDIALGNKPDIQKRHEMASAIRYFYVSEGKILGFYGIHKAEQIKDVKQISFVRNIGDYINEIRSSTDRIGFVISQSNTVNEAIEACEKAIELVKIETSNFLLNKI